MSFCLTAVHGRAGVRAGIIMGDNAPKKVLRTLPPVKIDNREKN